MLTCWNPPIGIRVSSDDCEFNDAAHDRHHAGTDDSTQQAIEQSHDRLLTKMLPNRSEAYGKIATAALRFRAARPGRRCARRRPRRTEFIDFGHLAATL